MDATNRPWWFTKQDGDLTAFPANYSLLQQVGHRHFIMLPDGSEAVVFYPEKDEPPATAVWAEIALLPRMTAGKYRV